MKTVQLRDAKAQLSALVDAAESGEPTTITRHGKPAAMVVPDRGGAQDLSEKKPSFADWLHVDAGRHPMGAGPDAAAKGGVLTVVPPGYERGVGLRADVERKAAIRGRCRALLALDHARTRTACFLSAITSARDRGAASQAGHEHAPGTLAGGDGRAGSTVFLEQFADRVLPCGPRGRADRGCHDRPRTPAKGLDPGLPDIVDRGDCRWRNDMTLLTPKPQALRRSAACAPIDPVRAPLPTEPHDPHRQCPRRSAPRAAPRSPPRAGSPKRRSGC